MVAYLFITTHYESFVNLADSVLRTSSCFYHVNMFTMVLLKQIVVNAFSYLIRSSLSHI